MCEETKIKMENGVFVTHRFHNLHGEGLTRLKRCLCYREADVDVLRSDREGEAAEGDERFCR